MTQPIDENGVEISHVAPSPQPVTWNISKYGHMQVAPNETVPVFRVTFYLSTGTTELFLPAPSMKLLADHLAQSAVGLTIAHDLGGLDT